MFHAFPSYLAPPVKCTQIMRQTPMTPNIMTYVPRIDTQKVKHCRLLLCLFKPFFDLDDLNGIDESWPEAMERVDEHGLWDRRTKPFRLNIAAMLRQQLAADEEGRRREHDAAAVSRVGGNGGGTDEEDDEHYLDAGGEDGSDLEGNSVIEYSQGRLLTSLFVADAVDAFVHAGFLRHDSSPAGAPSDPVAGRSSEDFHADLSRITSSSGERVKAYMARQENTFEMMDGNRVASLGDDTATASRTTTRTTSRTFDAAALEPYIMQLCKGTSRGKSSSQIRVDTARRDRNNEEAACSHIGAYITSQHVVAQRLADEYGLHPQQRLAFFISPMAC